MMDGGYQKDLRRTCVLIASSQRNESSGL